MPCGGGRAGAGERAAPMEVRVLHHDYGVDLLVSDRFEFMRAFPQIPCDRVSFTKLGKSLMLPVACLPICGILMGLGYWMCPATMQGGEINGIIQQYWFLSGKSRGSFDR